MKTHKKIYIASIIAVAVVAIITGIIIFALSRQGTVSKTLNLGNEYLSELNYDSAIREYSKVVVLDPLNEQAIEGLAKSYAGKGDVKMVEALLNNELAGNRDVDLLSSYAKILEDSGDYKKAADIVSTIIEIEDDTNAYEWLDTIIARCVDGRYEYAGNNHAVVELRDGKVYTKGKNVLGALGTAVGLGENTVNTQFQSAQFKGNAKKVFTCGAGVAVIDETGNLWISGSNRSGQKGTEKTELLATEGWQEITAISNVAKVSGRNNTIFALTSDGSLYMSGMVMMKTGGMKWTDQWSLLAGYGKVLDVQCGNSVVAFMTSDGKLYSDYNSDWYNGNNLLGCIAKDVAGYTVSTIENSSQDNISYYTSNGAVYNFLNRIKMPDAWYTDDGNQQYYKPPFDIIGIAQVEDSLFLLSVDKKLYIINNAQVNEISVDGEIESIYSSNGKCIVVIKDGNYRLIDALGMITT